MYATPGVHTSVSSLPQRSHLHNRVSLLCSGRIVKPSVTEAPRGASVVPTAESPTVSYNCPMISLTPQRTAAFAQQRVGKPAVLLEGRALSAGVQQVIVSRASAAMQQHTPRVGHVRASAAAATHAADTSSTASSNDLTSVRCAPEGKNSRDGLPTQCVSWLGREGETCMSPTLSQRDWAQSVAVHHAGSH